MEIDGFLDALEGCAEFFRWSVNGEGALRGRSSGPALCPITALAKHRFPTKCFMVSHVWEAARELGLDDAYTQMIVAAADNKMCDDPPIALMRKLLTQVVGVKETV